LISYPHKFFWNFSQFLAIYFELFSSGGNFRFPRRPRLSARRRRVAATRAHHAAPLTHLKGAVGTTRWRPDSCSDRASPLSAPRCRLASRAPIPTASSSVSDADRRCPSVPPSLSGRLLRRELFHGERSPSPLLPLFLPWNVEPSSLSLQPDAGPPPATRALASLENAAADPVFPPPRRQGAPVSYRLHPHARRVGSPPWVLERRLLLHLHHCSAAVGRDTCSESGDRSGVHSRAAPRHRGPCRPRPAQQAVRRVRCAHGPSRRCGRGPCATVQLGRARFRPSGSRISFPFSEYIQIFANLKKNV
jgi:hypothetical protein